MIINITKGTTIFEKTKAAKSFVDRNLGLLRSKNRNTALILKSRFGIHTIFMKYPIDVLVLNNEKKVVSIKENLQPNNLFFWNPKYEIIIEVPAGTVRASKTSSGDLLEF